MLQNSAPHTEQQVLGLPYSSICGTLGTTESFRCMHKPGGVRALIFLQLTLTDGKRSHAFHSHQLSAWLLRASWCDGVQLPPVVTSSMAYPCFVHSSFSGAPSQPSTVRCPKQTPSMQGLVSISASWENQAETPSSQVSGGNTPIPDT